MTPEQKFWQLIKDHIPGHFNRVENSMGTGMPDVEFCYQGKQTWVELKAGSELRLSQEIWHQKRVLNGGRVIVIARVNNDIVISQASTTLKKYYLLCINTKPWDWDYLEKVIKGEV